MGIFEGLFPHRHDRNDKDTSQDVLLLLYLFKKCGGRVSDKDTFSARIKLMKLVFLSEYLMVMKNMKGFNFFFNIYKRGPSSMELLKILDHLVDRGLIEKDRSGYSLKKDGKLTIDDFIHSKSENKQFFGIIDEVVNEYGKLDTEKLLAKIYKMNVKPIHSTKEINIGNEVKCSEKKPGKRLLMRLDKDCVQKELDVSPEWIETINILLNPSFSR